jgi:hypothetical protein
MSTGSWTVGSPSGGFYATKAWAGQDGKYESWAGGIRAKWNNYALTHVKRTQIPPPVGFNVPVPPNYSATDMRGVVGWSNNDDLRLLNKLAEAVKGHSFDLGINIAEATKSYGTIVSNVRSIGSALLQLKRGNVAGALRLLGSGRRAPSRGQIASINAKDLSGRWLETQYAFLPLVSQSYEAAKALKAVTGPRKFRFSVGSSAKRNSQEGSDTTPNYSMLWHTSYSKRLVAELYEGVELGRSLGLTNPAAIAWEIVPYSFVVDWFLPIGSYLSAWGVIPSLKGRFLTIEHGAVKNGAINDHTIAQNYAKSCCHQSRYCYGRVFSTSLSVPHPSFRSVPSALSPRRLLSAVALIHQRLR